MRVSETFGLSLGERLRLVREDHRLTKKAIAEMLKISPSTWGSFENDRTVPSQATAVSFCSIFHVREEWLWENEGDVYEEDYRPGDPLGEPVDYDQMLREQAEDMQMSLLLENRTPEEAKEIREAFELTFYLISAGYLLKDRKQYLIRYIDEPE